MLYSIFLTPKIWGLISKKRGNKSVCLSANILVSIAQWLSVLAQYSRNPWVWVQVETQLVTICYMDNFDNYVQVICMDLQPLDTTCSLKPPVQDDPMTRPASSPRPWPPPVVPVCSSGTTCMAPTSIPLMSTPRVVDNLELQSGATQVNDGIFYFSVPY